MRRWIPRFACFALAFSFSTAFAQKRNHSSWTEKSPAAQQKPSSQKNITFDRQFVRKAAMGNRAEIELARLAQQKASSPQVKNLARTIAQDHLQAQHKLQEVAQDTNVSMPSRIPREAAREKKKLSSLTGDQFDHAYVQYIMQEHKKNISEFEKATELASGADVRQYATSTLPDLHKHLRLADQAVGQMPSTQAQE